MVDTDRLMSIALEMSNLKEVPGDSAVFHPGGPIQRLLFGIDIRSAELKIAKDLGFDGAISHHPIGGRAMLRFHEVLWRHADQMVAAGVPRETARRTIEAMAENRRIVNSTANYDHDPSIARLLDLPFLNIHTPLDEIGRARMAAVAGTLGEEARVSDLCTALYDGFGEFRHAGTDIEVRAGRAESRLGRIAFSHGAGTNGGFAVAKAYFDHGVDTLVYIHCRPDEAQRIEAEYDGTKNLVVTGHIASDSIGINPYIDRLREIGIDVTPVSGIVPA